MVVAVVVVNVVWHVHPTKKLLHVLICVLNVAWHIMASDILVV